MHCEHPHRRSCALGRTSHPPRSCDAPLHGVALRTCKSLHRRRLPDGVPFLPAGDWHDFVAGLPAPLLWKLALTALGIGGYIATMAHAQRDLEAFLGSDSPARRARARTLTLIPYIIGGTVETLSSIVGGGGILTLISAAPATFGGTIGVPIVGLRAAYARAPEPSSALPLRRAPIILVIGLLVAIVHIFWFGP